MNEMVPTEESLGWMNNFLLAWAKDTMAGQVRDGYYGRSGTQRILWQVRYETDTMAGQVR